MKRRVFEKGIGEFVLETYMKKNNITFDQARRMSVITPIKEVGSLEQ